MSAADRIRKKRELLEIQKNGGSQLDVSKKRIEQNKKELATTGKIEYIEAPQLISPIKRKDDDDIWYKNIFKGSDAFKGVTSAFKDGYDFGDISKTIVKGGKATVKTTLATGADLGLNLIEGVARVGEGVGTLGAAGVAQIADWTGHDEYAEKVRDRLAQKEENAFGTKGGPLSAWLNQAQEKVNKNSILGSTGDEVASMVGYTGGLMVGGNALGGLTKTGTIGSVATSSAGVTTGTGVAANLGNIGITVAGKTLNVPTLAFVGGASSGLQEAYSKENVTDKQAWLKALGSGTIEGVTEGLFGMFGVGGSSLDDAAVKFATDHFKSGMAKVLASTGVKASGEAIEELISYTGNYGLNILIDKASNENSAEFYKEWDWEEVGEQMALAFLSGGITQGGGSVASIQAQTNVAVKEAEKQLGRKLTADEKKSIRNQITNVVVNGDSIPNNLSPVGNNVTQTNAVQPQATSNTTIEEIDNQIATLESQLNENLSDEQYNEIINQIQVLEAQAEQIEQNGQPTTQEVETNSLVEPSSNTLDTGNVQTSPVSPVMSGQVSGQVSGQLQTAETLQKSAENTAVQQEAIELDEDEAYVKQKKQEQFEIIQKNNPMTDNYHVGIRSAEEIKDFADVIDDEESFVWGDFSKEDAINALQKGRVKVYSSNPIKQGTFVSTSKNQAMDYAGNGKVYSKEINLDEIAWINGDEGQVASTTNFSGIDGFESKPKPEWTKSREGVIEHHKKMQKEMNEGKKAGDNHYVTDKDVEAVIESSLNMGGFSPLKKGELTSNVQEDLSPINKAVEDLKQVQNEVKKQVENLETKMDEFKALTKEQYQGLQTQLDEANSQEQTPPPEVEVYNDKLDNSALDDRTVNKITKDFARGMKLNKTQKAELNSAIKDISSYGNATVDDVLDVLYNYDEMSVRQRNEEIAEAKGDLKNINSLKINQTIANDVDMPKLRQLAKNNLKFKVDDMGNVDMYYEELSNKYPHLFPSDVITPSQQFEIMVDIASTPIYSYESLKVPHGTLFEEAQYMYDLMQDFKIDQKTKDADKDYKEWVKSLRKTEAPQEVNEEVELAPVKEEISKEAFTKKVEELSGEIKNELGYIPKDPTRAESYEYDEEIAEILDSEPKTDKQKKNRTLAILKANLLDKGMVFEDLAIKNKNRELQGKWDYTLTSESRAQYVIGNGHVDKNGNQTSKSLNDIMAEVNNTGLTKEFYDYIYHKHNVDRMNLSARFEGMVDKPVFGHSVTSEVSQRKVNEYEMAHPEFMDFAQDVYDYVNADRAQLVNEGVISQETADLWQQMYPHYVPIRRADHNGNAINVALDTNRTGINAPIKKATGGNSDILPLFDTMAQRTIQTQRATAKNKFGIELKNTLKAKGITNDTNVDEVIDSVDNQEGLLQEGKKGTSPTFTVFENGKRVTYEITEDMYDALKPISDSSLLSKTSKTLNTASNIHRGLLTQYNIFFALKNGVKDVQDVLINSQHAAKTYSKIPEAYAQLLGKGHWYNEYMRNGGEQNSYFDSQEMNFDTQHKGISKVLDFWPIKKVAQLNDFIERVPRLAEYIASREAGRSIEVSMLDAARVTTNFKAGGNVTKFANRNGATFLNASVQGALQQVRNIREANMNGFKGWVNLATKFTIAGLPAMLLNALLWEDDEEYEELSDYVKQNYYIVGKYGDGQFIRIPKGRTVAVIQDGIEQISNAATGNDEVDLASFLELATTNLAPTNPLENNIFAPIIQAATNKTWYGDDLVPSRLADLPAEEQFDETTDSFSRWLGEKTGISPVKINYLLNQYSGVVGDIVMPMITPKATQEDGNPLLAPLKDIFTVDGVMKNQNVSDFYETSEKLTTGAKSKDATDEDILKNKYINSVKTELNELYKEKREIQSDETLSKSEKYRQSKEVQKKINALTKDALSKYDDGNYTDNYGIIDDKEYYINSKGDWTAVREKEQNELNEMGMTIEEKSAYFEGKNEISRIVNDYKDDKEDLNETYEDEELKNKIDTLSSEKKTNIIKVIQNTGLSEEQQAYLYKKYYKTNAIDNVISTDIGVNNYFDYIQQEFTADYNKKGNAIPNTRKNKVINYVNGYDLTIAQKAILIKSTNTFKFNDYNYEIVEYVGGLDISYEEKVRILEDLDMKVYDNGTVEWE